MILNGDALTILPTLPTASVDIVVNYPRLKSWACDGHVTVASHRFQPVVVDTSIYASG
jgi:hypothetical protein